MTKDIKPLEPDSFSVGSPQPLGAKGVGKYDKVYEEFRNMEPGFSLPIAFPNAEKAKHARHYITTTLRKMCGGSAEGFYRTRIEHNSNNTTLYIIKLSHLPGDLPRPQPEEPSEPKQKGEVPPEVAMQLEQPGEKKWSLL